MFRKRIDVLLVAIVFPCGIMAQFRNKCSVDSVKESGFYSIAISPQLSEYVKLDLSDLRITNAKGQWVPHIINWQHPSTTGGILRFAMPIITKETANSQTTIVMDNVQSAALSNFSLTVKNTSANRFASISGSDDKAMWFTITDSVLLKDAKVYPDSSVFSIFFTPVNYQYYRIIILNGKNNPLNVQTVATEHEGLPEKIERFIVNPENSFSQTDTSQYSLIKIPNKDHFHVSRLRILISSPKYFERQVAFYTSYPGSIQQLLRKVPEKEFTISTNNSSEYDLPLSKSNSLLLLIENKDNPPLKLSSIATMQERKQLVAYLEKGERYQLVFNDSLATSPNYDLRRFQDTIPTAVSVLNTGKIELLAGSKANTGIIKSNKWWLWPTIIVVVLFLGYLTMTLARDVNKHNKRVDAA